MECSGLAKGTGYNGSSPQHFRTVDCPEILADSETIATRTDYIDAESRANAFCIVARMLDITGSRPKGLFAYFEIMTPTISPRVNWRLVSRERRGEALLEPLICPRQQRLKDLLERSATLRPLTVRLTNLSYW